MPMRRARLDAPRSHKEAGSACQINQEEIHGRRQEVQVPQPRRPATTHQDLPSFSTLDSLDGKEIWLSITGEPDITIALERRLKMDYPNVNWRVKKTYGPVQIPLSDEEMKTAQGVIQGVCW